ncbi:hypothetical protein M4D55_00160 [Metabacillus idriensis]|nr:hypothetical protein [Metabacillus idriensis]MCM3594195.1 hypothetical protein [Metabacillus idriensis]
MELLEKCLKCAGTGLMTTSFPNEKEACFYCQGTGFIKEIDDSLKNS